MNKIIYQYLKTLKNNFINTEPLNETNIINLLYDIISYVYNANNKDTIGIVDEFLTVNIEKFNLNDVNPIIANIIIDMEHFLHHSYDGIAQEFHATPSDLYERIKTLKNNLSNK